MKDDIIYQMILDDVKPNPFPDDEDEKYTGVFFFFKFRNYYRKMFLMRL